MYIEYTEIDLCWIGICSIYMYVHVSVLMSLCFFTVPIGDTYANLLNVLNEGLITEDMIDTSVVRLMKAFISLGVLDPPDSVPYNK